MEQPDNLDPRDLPLKKDIIDSLLQWADKFDALLNWDDPASSGFGSEEESMSFEKEGIRLWLLLREQLQSDYEVYYKSHRLHQLISDPSLSLESSSI